MILLLQTSLAPAGDGVGEAGEGLFLSLPDKLYPYMYNVFRRHLLQSVNHHFVIRSLLEYCWIVVARCFLPIIAE